MLSLKAVDMGQVAFSLGTLLFAPSEWLWVQATRLKSQGP